MKYKKALLLAVLGRRCLDRKVFLSLDSRSARPDNDDIQVVRALSLKVRYKAREDFLARGNVHDGRLCILWPPLVRGEGVGVAR